MNILIVENNDIKYRMLKKWLDERFTQCVVERASSYQSGLKAIIKGGYDWILLDMTLPVYDEEGGMLAREQLTFGGQYILREMMRKGIKVKVIVVTQYRTFLRDGIRVTFEELRNELLENFGEFLSDCVFLKGIDQRWMSELEQQILKNDENNNNR